MTNAEIAGVFDEVAALLEARGDNIFKIRAYRTAARSIEQLPEELAQMVASGKDLEDIPGVGPAIARKITELITTGHLRLYDELRSEAGSTENAR